MLRPTPEAKEGAGMTLFELLRDSHDIQRSLCRQLTATRGDTARRELLFLQLKIELEAHAAAEERYLYCPILLSDAGLSVSRHALAEHHDIEEYCEDLSVRHKAGDEWLAIARKLSEKVRHHLKEEEKKFFQVAGRILPDKQKLLLAKRYEKDLLRMRRKLAADYRSVDIAPSGKVQPSR
jgi:hypothetical protein